MKLLSATCLFATLHCVASAQVTLPDAIAARSVSGQFVVFRAQSSTASRVANELAANTNHVELEPALLAVSCERIKQALERELPGAGAWRGRISLAIRPAQGPRDQVDLVCVPPAPNNWSYRVMLPQFLERRLFTYTIVQTLLLEQANRRAGQRSAEIPRWLLEGLTEHFLNSREMEFILPPPRWKVNGLTIGPAIDVRAYNPLRAAHDSLNDRPPLTLAELSWPTDEQLSGRNGETYRRSAQLFVSELLRLPKGRECLRRMVDELGQCYNWQTAFFRAFSQQFAQQLDLEKWWALQVVHFTGRSPEQLWTVGESWRQLDQILRPAIEIRRTVSEAPARTEVTLQALIRQFDFPQQSPTLKSRIHDLEMARMRMTPDLGPLLEEYRKTLTTYVQNRDRVNLKFLTTRTGPGKLHPAAEEAIKQLDALDAKRLKLRPQESPASPLPVDDQTAAR